MQQPKEERLYVEKLAQSLLKGRIFTGVYLEKRYVKELNDYRDVIRVCDNEVRMIEDATNIAERWQGGEWMGITKNCGDTRGLYLWTNLKQEIFGKYWFKVKRMHFGVNECYLVIEQLRTVEDDAMSAPEINFDLNESMEQLKNNIIWLCLNIWQLMTWDNIKDTTIYLVVLTMTLFTTLVHAAKFLLEYFLRLLDRLAILINVSTPIFLKIIEMVTKMYGGLLLLIAMFFKKDDRGAQQTYNQQLAVGFGDHTEMIRRKQRQPYLS